MTTTTLTKFLNVSRESKHAALGRWYRYRARKQAADLCDSRLLTRAVLYQRLFVLKISVCPRARHKRREFFRRPAMFTPTNKRPNIAGRRKNSRLLCRARGQT